jgi:hypothetical protein
LQRVFFAWRRILTNLGALYKALKFPYEFTELWMLTPLLEPDDFREAMCLLNDIKQVLYLDLIVLINPNN